MPPADSHARRVLLIDAVTWSAAYAVSSPLRDVYGWYHRWVESVPGVRLDRWGLENSDEPSLTGISGVILSGSPRDAWNDDPVNHRLMTVIHRCQEGKVPFLGVCYGHQLLARALGGTVRPHLEGLELGNTPVRLTEAGRRSLLFAGLESSFDVLSSHGDEVVEMPAGAELTVAGDFTDNQGFHYGDRLQGVQFHPETDPDVLRFIWELRIEKWQPRVTFDLRQRLVELRPTPNAPKILQNFVKYCLTAT